MATAAVTNQFTASTTIVSDDVDTNFGDLVTFLNGSVLHLDGAKAMSGDLDMGNQDINNVPWKAWSPSYANLTVGNGTVVARYIQIGDLVVAYWSFLLGSSSVMGNTPTVSVPATAASHYVNLLNTVGRVQMKDNSGGLTYPGPVRLNTTSVFSFLAEVASNAHVSEANITAILPFTWGTSDRASFTAVFEAA